MRIAKCSNAFTGETADAAVLQTLNARETRQYVNGVKVTDELVCYRKGLKRLYLPFSDIVWAYLQVAESHVTLGCCGGVLEEFRVLCYGASGAPKCVSFERKAQASDLLALISSGNTECRIGFTDENKALFAERLPK